MDNIEVYRSEWMEWRRSKVTKALVQDILRKREMLKEGYAEGAHESEQARLVDIGRCQAMKDIIDYVIADFDVVIDNPKDGEKDDV